MIEKRLPLSNCVMSVDDIGLTWKGSRENKVVQLCIMKKDTSKLENRWFEQLQKSEILPSQDLRSDSFPSVLSELLVGEASWAEKDRGHRALLMVVSGKASRRYDRSAFNDGSRWS